MSNRVFVTGIGMISAIGNNVPEALAAIQAGRSGIGQIKHLNTLHKGELPVGEVKCADNDLLNMIGSTTSIPYSRTALLGMIAAKEAWQHAGITDSDEARTGLISATS